MNKQLTKDEYERKLKEYYPKSNSQVDKIYSWLNNMTSEQAYHPECYSLNSEDVTGNHIYNSKNLETCFDCKRCEDSSYLYTALEVSESCDLSFNGGNSSFCLNSLTLAESERCCFSHHLKNCYDVAYSEFCYSSKNLFACNGLRNAEYCILNKQYSKEEYFALRNKLINHMLTSNELGYFFPEKYTPFAFNESVVSEYYDLDKEAALKLGYKWLESEKIIGKNKLVIDSLGWDEALLKETFSCQKTSYPFKYIKQELDFYKRFSHR